VAFRGHAGFSIGEVTLTIAIIGVLAVLSTPLFLGYYQAARLKGATEEVAALLNHGRQIGIKENVGVCVEIGSTSVRYRTGDCAGATWLGPGTDAAGFVPVPDGISLTATGNPRFTYLGAASPPGATYAVTATNARTGASLRVFVAASGRTTIGP
jgi:Tfp pilus assembly protein FimT